MAGCTMVQYDCYCFEFNMHKIYYDPTDDIKAYDIPKGIAQESISLSIWF